MSTDPRGDVVRVWIEKAHEAIASARSEHAAGRLAFAVNRCYYAAFYAASAVLLCRGHRFRKHTGVRAGIHRELVKPGLLPETWGRTYDRLFQDRQEGDYLALTHFEADEVEETIRHAEALVGFLERLIPGKA